MTRKELAKEIYRLNFEKGVYNVNTNITEERFVRACIKGVGAVQAHTKSELENWYNNLLNR